MTLKKYLQTSRESEEYQDSCLIIHYQFADFFNFVLVFVQIHKTLSFLHISFLHISRYKKENIEECVYLRKNLVGMYPRSPLSVHIRAQFPTVPANI